MEATTVADKAAASYSLILRGGGAASSGPWCVFVFPGEGTHSRNTDIAGLSASPSWGVIEASLQRLGLADALDSFLWSNMGEHEAPLSPVVTTTINIINANRWRGAGRSPNLVLGHSIGEVAAAHVTGLLSVEDAMRTALLLGRLGERIKGAMLYTFLTRAQVDTWSDTDLCIAAVNAAVHGTDLDANGDKLSVTLCGPDDHVNAWLADDSNAKRLSMPHPWHHPSYLRMPDIDDELGKIPRGAGSLDPTAPIFVSAVTGERVQEVDVAFWKAWLGTPVKFDTALQRTVQLLESRSVYTIEMGAHPVLTGYVADTLRASGVPVLASAVSMRRNRPDSLWLDEEQRLVTRLAIGSTEEILGSESPSTRARERGSERRGSSMPEDAHMAIFTAMTDGDADKARFASLIYTKESAMRLVAELARTSMPAATMPLSIDMPLMEAGMTSLLMPRFIKVRTPTPLAFHPPCMNALTHTPHTNHIQSCADALCSWHHSCSLLAMHRSLVSLSTRICPRPLSWSAAPSAQSPHDSLDRTIRRRWCPCVERKGSAWR
jgi:hypothetical protein